MNEKTFTYSDIHEMQYGDWDIQPISKYGDCGFKLSYREDGDEDFTEVRCTVFDALAIVQEKQREINGDDFEVMETDDDILSMLDRWAFETVGLWLEDMKQFYLDVNIKGGIPKPAMNTSPDANDPDPERVVI